MCEFNGKRWYELLQLFATLSDCAPTTSAVCRYLILYDQGGVYADSDVKCIRPMASVLRPEDGLVTTWEDINSKAKHFAHNPLPAQVRLLLSWLVQ